MSDKFKGHVNDVKLISHRGNIKGPGPGENRPTYIDEAIRQGFDVEIDVWFINGKLRLGHDNGEYSIDRNWLSLRWTKLWVHCKNNAAAEHLSGTCLNYFAHDKDPFVITSKGFTWIYPDALEPNSKSIIVMPEWNNPNFNGLDNKSFAGICSDYIGVIKDKYVGRTI